MQINLGSTPKEKEKEEGKSPYDHNSNIYQGDNVEGGPFEYEKETAIEIYEVKFDEAVGNNHKELIVEFNLLELRQTLSSLLSTSNLSPARKMIWAAKKKLTAYLGFLFISLQIVSVGVGRITSFWQGSCISHHMLRIACDTRLDRIWKIFMLSMSSHR
jgi:hypothetical protein